MAQHIYESIFGVGEGGTSIFGNGIENTSVDVPTTSIMPVGPTTGEKVTLTSTSLQPTPVAPQAKPPVLKVPPPSKALSYAPVSAPPMQVAGRYPYDRAVHPAAGGGIFKNSTPYGGFGATSSATDTKSAMAAIGMDAGDVKQVIEFGAKFRAWVKENPAPAGTAMAVLYSNYVDAVAAGKTTAPVGAKVGKQDNTMLYVGIGVGALALIGGIAWYANRKPSSAAV